MTDYKYAPDDLAPDLFPKTVRVPQPAGSVYVVAWTGGYEPPSFAAFADVDVATAKAKEWAADSTRQNGDQVDLLQLDLATMTLEGVDVPGGLRNCGECFNNVVSGVHYDADSGTVERCGECNVFDGDLGAALAVAEKLGKQAWFIRHDHTTNEYRITLVTREIVVGPDDGWSIAEQTDPWIGEPDPEQWAELPDGQNGVITVLPPLTQGEA